MWMKRLSLLLVVIFSLSVFSLVGCSNQQRAETQAPAQPAPAATQPAPEVNEEEIVAEAVKGYFTAMPADVILDAAKVKDQLSAFYIIDIRKPEDYAKGHIEGAVNIGMAQLGEKMGEFPTDKPLLLVCYTGQNASHSTALLRLAGFDAHWLKGGFVNGWEKESLPVVQ